MAFKIKYSKSFPVPPFIQWMWSSSLDYLSSSLKKNISVFNINGDSAHANYLYKYLLKLKEKDTLYIFVGCNFDMLKNNKAKITLQRNSEFEGLSYSHLIYQNIEQIPNNLFVCVPPSVKGKVDKKPNIEFNIKKDSFSFICIYNLLCNSYEANAETYQLFPFNRLMENLLYQLNEDSTLLTNCLQVRMQPIHIKNRWKDLYENEKRKVYEYQQEYSSAIRNILSIQERIQQHLGYIDIYEKEWIRQLNSSFIQYMQIQLDPRISGLSFRKDGIIITIKSLIVNHFKKDVLEKVDEKENIDIYFYADHVCVLDNQYKHPYASIRNKDYIEINSILETYNTLWANGQYYELINLVLNYLSNVDMNHPQYYLYSELRSAHII